MPRRRVFAEGWGQGRAQHFSTTDRRPGFPGGPSKRGEEFEMFRSF